MYRYKLMLKCWEVDAAKRMSFKDITEEFGEIASGYCGDNCGQ